MDIDYPKARLSSQTTANAVKELIERDKPVPGRVCFDTMNTPGKLAHRNRVHNTLPPLAQTDPDVPSRLQLVYIDHGYTTMFGQPNIYPTESASTAAASVATEPFHLERFMRKQHTAEPPGNALDRAFELVGPQITANAESKRRHEQKLKLKFATRDSSDAGPSAAAPAKARNQGVARLDKGKGKQRAVDTPRRTTGGFSDDSWEDEGDDMLSADEDVDAGRSTTVPTAPPLSRPVSGDDAQGDSDDEIVFPSKSSKTTAPRAQDSSPVKAAPTAGRARLLRPPPPAPPTRPAAPKGSGALAQGHIWGAKSHGQRTDKAKGKQRAPSPSVDRTSDHEDAMAVDEPEDPRLLGSLADTQPWPPPSKEESTTVSDTRPWLPRPAAPATPARPSARASASGSTSSHASPHATRDAPHNPQNVTRVTRATSSRQGPPGQTSGAPPSPAPAPATPAPPTSSTQKRAKPRQLGLTGLHHVKSVRVHGQYKPQVPASPLDAASLAPSQTQVVIAQVVTTIGFPVRAPNAAGGGTQVRGAPMAGRAEEEEGEAEEPPSSYDQYFEPLDMLAVERIMAVYDRRPTV